MMKAKFVHETLYEAFEEKSKDMAKKDLLFPGLSSVKDLDSYKKIVAKHNISAKAIPNEIKEKIYKQFEDESNDYNFYISKREDWRGYPSDWEIIKNLFSTDQISKLLDKASNSFHLGLHDNDKGIVINALKKQNLRISQRYLKDGIRAWGDDFLTLLNTNNIKLTSMNLIDIGLETGDKEYIEKGLARGGKGRAGDINRIKEIIGEKEYNKKIMSKLTPEEIFTRGFYMGDSNLMLKGIKAGAKNIHQGNQEAFTVACLNSDLKIIDALMKSPGFDPALNPKVGVDNHVDERHYGIRQAAKRGNIDVVKRLLKDPRVDPSYRKNFALKWAIKGHYDDIVKLLLKDKRVKNNLHTLPRKYLELLKNF